MLHHILIVSNWLHLYIGICVLKPPNEVGTVWSHEPGFHGIRMVKRLHNTRFSCLCAASVLLVQAGNFLHLWNSEIPFEHLYCSWQGPLGQNVLHHLNTSCVICSKAISLFQYLSNAAMSLYHIISFHFFIYLSLLLSSLASLTYTALTLFSDTAITSMILCQCPKKLTTTMIDRFSQPQNCL